MSSAFFSVSTRRLSISLYQRARYSSFVQGTLPASQLPTESLSNGGNLTRKQVPKKKGVIAPKKKMNGENKKPKPPQYTQLKSQGETAAQHGIKVVRGRELSIPGGLTIVEMPKITMLGGIAHERAVMAARAKEHCDFLDELRSRFPKNFSMKDLDKFVAEWESRRG